MDDKFKTIKVLTDSVKDLNLIAAITGEKQYQVVERLSKIEKKEVTKPNKPKNK
jgi:hypothetical protein